MCWGSVLSMPPTTDAKTLRILMVCTGNICRSPLAERLLAARLADAGVSAEVSSAGTGAMVGDPMTPETAALVRPLGGIERPHAARQLDSSMIRDADLILTATRQHRAAVVSLMPTAVPRTFTLLEFARLAAAMISVDPDEPTVSMDAESMDAESVDTETTDGDRPAPAAALIGSIAARRSTFAQIPGGDDIVDPYRRSKRVYAEVGAVIDAGTRVSADALARVAR